MADLDPVIHAQARLRIVATLATLEPTEQISFPRLQELLEMTAGNLSTHARKLEDAGYVEILKAFVWRKPQTQARITKAGRAAFAQYLQAMTALVDGQG